MKQFDELNYSVTRISCNDANGNSSSGTGFITAIHDNGDSHNPILVTNKHVIKDQSNIQICLNVLNEQGEIIPDNSVNVELPNESNWYLHPDPEIDLCALPIGIVLNNLRGQKRDVVWKTIHPNWIPDKVTLNQLDTVEDVIMIGYPIGIWDNYNNRPLFRKGITSTHPALEFNKKRNFMVDIAAFPGSSGSPIFAYKEGLSIVNSAGTKIANQNGKFHMIGVLFAGPMFNAEGTIQITNIPTSQAYNIHSRIPTNLGYAIPSYIIKDFEHIIPKSTKGY